jgi:hypothetical protein
MCKQRLLREGELLMGIADELGVYGQVLLWLGNGNYCCSRGYTKLTYPQALKRIEVIADDESEIIEAVRRMSTNYDFIVTSGGIGPT